jgi:glycosyltransferase involved in cell wall biosynthesis
VANILFLSQLLPYPPDAGPKVRSYHVLRRLSEKHRVTLLAFTRQDDQPGAVEHLRTICAAVETAPIRRSRGRDLKALIESLARSEPFIIRRDFIPQMAQKVDRLLEAGSFDAVHADQLWMAQYALRARQAGKNCRIILDEHNACFQIFQRLTRQERNPLRRTLLEREWRVLAHYEANTCARFDQVVTVTDEDRQTLVEQIEAHAGQRGSHPKFTTIPICVDPEAVCAVKPGREARDVLHLGTMFFLPNVEGVLWFARRVWPAIAAQAPEVRFMIVGKNPPQAVQELGGLNLAGERNAAAGQRSQITVTGYVANPKPYLEKAAVFIVPLHSGGGMRVKILDAWAWGLPVVSTRIGAEGLHYRDGENLLIADGAEEFAQAVLRVLCEPGLAERLRENGRRWVEAHYNWRQVYPAWDAIYDHGETKRQA